METLEQAAEVFQTARPRLFGIAYRMVGTASEAEDIVQDAWLRWQATDRSVVRDAVAFLVTTTTRLAINTTQSARARRETYIGPWLPEPVDTRNDPYLGAERNEALELAVLMLLESLSEAERAAYVLREAFQYEYPAIAEIVQVTETNARQMVSRARKKIGAERRRAVSAEERLTLLEAFLGAAQGGDLAALEALFAAEVVSYADGGGVVTAARVPVAGRARVAKFIAAFSTHFWIDTTFAWMETNGQSAVLVSRGGKPLALASIDVSSEGIERILWVMNPAKLSQIAHLSGPS